MSPSKDQIEKAPSLVEELAALLREFIPTATTSERAAHTVLSALASKGVDGMPSVDEIGQHCWDTLSGEDSSIGWAECDRFAPVMHEFIRSRLGPILAAKDAELQIEREQRQRFGDIVEQRTAERDALRARVAELEARISTNGDKQ